MAKRLSAWMERLEDRRLLAGMLAADPIALVEADAVVAAQSNMTVDDGGGIGVADAVWRGAALRAVVSGAAGVGTVKFLDGQEQIGQANINTLGEAVVTVSNLAVVMHSITAQIQWRGGLAVAERVGGGGGDGAAGCIDDDGAFVEEVDAGGAGRDVYGGGVRGGQ